MAVAVEDRRILETATQAMVLLRLKAARRESGLSRLHPVEHPVEASAACQRRLHLTTLVAHRLATILPAAAPLQQGVFWPEIRLPERLAVAPVRIPWLVALTMILAAPRLALVPEK
mmetsp:Transcript_73894/g.133208  ORF Transcript_73894/g.133208 Transcript_73894/m.133208 type:complete len:116 (+) Transcript_73894:541-888(+)